MPIIQDTLWKHPGHPGMIVISANSTIGRDGRLVMATTAAREAAQRIQGIERQCAEAIAAHSVDGFYGFLPVRPSRPDKRIIGFGIFQTQIEVQSAADPDLIRLSLERLKDFTAMHPDVKIRMNYPGIGEEGLDPLQVAPLLNEIPPTVTICHNGEVPPRISAGYAGVKELYVAVERWVLEGRINFAVEYLMENGMDEDEAAEQVSAVRRMIAERNERQAMRMPQHYEQRQLNL